MWADVANGIMYGVIILTIASMVYIAFKVMHWEDK